MCLTAFTAAEMTYTATLQAIRYYLVAHKSEHTPKEFNKVCNIISEYAYQKNYVPANEAFFKEHGNVIIEEAAIQTLAVL